MYARNYTKAIFFCCWRKPREESNYGSLVAYKMQSIDLKRSLHIVMHVQCKIKLMSHYLFFSINEYVESHHQACAMSDRWWRYRLDLIRIKNRRGQTRPYKKKKKAAISISFLKHVRQHNFSFDRENDIIFQFNLRLCDGDIWKHSWIPSWLFFRTINQIIRSWPRTPIPKPHD